jgi:hypothetical protein
MATLCRQSAPLQSPDRQAGVASAAPAAQSNEAAQGALAEKQGRSFRPLPTGGVIESHVDGQKLVAHIASLYGQMVSASVGRAFSAETPLSAFSGMDLAQTILAVAGSGQLLAAPTWDSGWQSAGGPGVSGEESFFGPTPIAQARVEITPLVGDAKAIARSVGTATSSQGGGSSASRSMGAEASAGAGGLQAGVSTGRESSMSATSGSSLSMALPMTAFQGVLGFDCKVSVKRAFGPPEARSGRIVAGEVAYQSVFEEEAPCPP